MLLLDIPPYLTELFGRSHYLAPFCVLLLCGVGLPLPEEVSLIGSGILVAQGEANFTVISLVCSAAILIGDSVPYWLGRHYGMAALKIRWVSKVLHPERFALLEKRFAEHGNWAVFAFRFLPGLRIPGYFSAGTLGMRYPRFVILDGLGVLLSVPLSIYLGMLFTDSVQALRKDYPGLDLMLAFLLISLLLFLLVRSRGRRRSLQAQELAALALDSQATDTPVGSEPDEQAS